MAVDIIRLDNTKGINNKLAVCSTLPTGKSSTLVVRSNYPVDLTIENIENKFTNRFDNPSYYYGGGASDGGYYSGS